MLNNLHSAVDLLPYFVGTVRQDDALSWKGACFYGNDARMELVQGDEDNELGGGVVYIKVGIISLIFFRFLDFLTL